MKELNPAFVKDFISNPITRRVFVFSLPVKECWKEVFRKIRMKDFNYVENIRL
jgi:hypothetical protein